MEVHVQGDPLHENVALVTCTYHHCSEHTIRCRDELLDGLVVERSKEVIVLVYWI